MNATNYRTQIFNDLAGIASDTWDGLLEADGGANVFLRHAFLHALHATGCASSRTGWAPAYLTLWHGDSLAAATPLYAKDHSYGEYVFDWSWAEAYQRAGLEYYPKWLSAVPFTPVSGRRLLARDAAARSALVEALLGLARGSRLSSLHVLLAPREDVALLESHGMLARRTVQFHWRNAGYTTFDDFLAALTQPKRKKIRAERRKVDASDVQVHRRVGREITEADWAFFHRCYRTTYAAHYSTPYLNFEFFLRLAEQMPESLMLVLARRGRRSIGAALGVYESTPATGRLYGRYWGAVEHVPCLHFECCYYQMIEFAIERKLAIFEGGAQGPHKMARGLDPVTTWSAHWLALPQMHAAVARFLARESQGVEHAIEELEEHRAFSESPPPLAG
ncbi:MAG TPA: GNAT family N-acetyltransferase [Burkholderiaceae bacterium]|nr:GNAT family N-acetyltransferase [Burkholderiaceae bacterium]